MKQAHVWRVVLVPVRSLVVVAASAGIDEVIALIGATATPGTMMIERQGRSGVILVNTAISAAMAEPFPGSISKPSVQGVRPSSAGLQATELVRQRSTLQPQPLRVGAGLGEEPLLLGDDALQLARPCLDARLLGA